MIADKNPHLKIRRLGLAMLFAGLAFCAAPAAADPNPKMTLAQQKAKLLETLINTPAMKAAQDGKNPEVANWLAQSRTLLAQANSAISAAHPEEAIEQLDEALRNLSKASSLLTADGSSGVGAQKKQFDNHASQIESYRRTLQEMTSTPQTAAAARQLIVRIDAMSTEGRKLFDAGRHEEANKRMAAAYKLAVEEISRLRDGQEVVMRLQFNSPREEFDYEQKRYYSNEILVGMLIREERATGDARKQVDAYVDAANSVKSEALAKASASDYPAAVKEMEKANQQLNRALQMMGVPVF
ncbi:hypothetical protein LZ012_09290 [Dechloromonas sp. XY25]|uniref:Uncharacterized protein n=1 Tax=Dechloromonas hankyongensis TaxID=2908002 RepID=A0ABS9K245_9RHOO|nr:hypothetical protein [Dechloromonas hankyongensis]MCG2577191.1 hypothetical protein [Dechloromonas hankyongensis]